ncbi:hypothetical protein M758_12G117600 [Ceratodon purpureus]|nr:hypothetical protein M758_12G117600 [Ceratodon purpureus]
MQNYTIPESAVDGARSSITRWSFIRLSCSSVENVHLPVKGVVHLPEMNNDPSSIYEYPSSGEAHSSSWEAHLHVENVIWY